MSLDTQPPPKPAVPWYERLSSQKVGKRAEEKKADDAIVTNLSVDSLRWIRKHRKVDCDEKVPLSYAHERQLREIFQGLDLTNSGIIDLSALQAAAIYVENSTRGKVGELKNIQAMFESMDEDGNGEIDFHEFTTAMTGSSRSAMNVMSADDVERMQRLFVDFANMRRRDFAVKTIDAGKLRMHREKEREATNEAKQQQDPESQSHHTGSVASGGASHSSASVPRVSDQEIYKQFELLFTAKSGEDIDEQITRTSQRDLRYLQYFEESMGERRAALQGEELAKEEAYREVQGRVKEERMRYMDSVRTDLDLLALHRRLYTDAQFQASVVKRERALRESCKAGEEARQRDSAHDPYPAPPGVARQLPNPKGTGTMVPTNLRYSCRAQLDLKRRAMLDASIALRSGEGRVAGSLRRGRRRNSGSTYGSDSSLDTHATGRVSAISSHK